MEQIFKIETTLTHELATLYQALFEEFEKKGGIPLAEMNRTLLQTGIIHHLIMMQGLGLITGERAEKIQALVDQVARETIMWELVQLARKYWRNSSGGLVNFKA